MNFQTHNDTALSNDNTSWTFSTIQATKAQITKAFGQPQELGGKVQFNWIIKFNDGTLATIYDWKQRTEIADTDLINWNIGGLASDASGRAVSAVHNAYREAHGLGAHRKVA